MEECENMNEEFITNEERFNILENAIQDIILLLLEIVGGD